MKKVLFHSIDAQDDEKARIRIILNLELLRQKPFQVCNESYFITSKISNIPNLDIYWIPDPISSLHYESDLRISAQTLRYLIGWKLWTGSILL